jgi:hypothetical protein
MVHLENDYNIETNATSFCKGNGDRWDYEALFSLPMFCYDEDTYKTKILMEKGDGMANIYESTRKYVSKATHLIIIL